MRVIAGKYKGRKLISPEDDNVRPTSDRIKETLFNILSVRSSVRGAKVLDLFSGSGALGIEALSCGAKEVFFVDSNKKSILLTKENLTKIGESIGKVFCAEFGLALKKLRDGSFDIILADPPYNKSFEEPVLSLILKYNVLRQGGIVMIEHDSDTVMPHFEDSFEYDCRKCGNTTLSFYKLI